MKQFNFKAPSEKNTYRGFVISRFYEPTGYGIFIF
jgi:hypothetical protein